MSRVPGWSAFRAALRIARRDALRARGRSLLVIAMIGLPVLGLTTADVLLRTFQLSPAERVSRDLGRADASMDLSGGPLEQDPQGVNSGSVGTDDGSGASQAPPPAELLAALPPGSRLLPNRGAAVQVPTRDGIALTRIRGLDYADPALVGLVRQVSGRAPRTTAEVALTAPLAKDLGLHTGDTMRTRRPEQSYAVVGIVEDRYQLRNKEAYALPAAIPASPENGGPAVDRYLIAAPGGVSWTTVMRLNALGYRVQSRSVLLNPPPRSDVPYYRHGYGGTSTSTKQAVAVAILAAGMALLEVVLLAGPAFAVGARRRRRDLALVAATGGESRHVRSVVLAGGLVLGAAAAVVGVALGVSLAAVLRPLFESRSGSVLGHFDVRPLELAGVALLSVGTGLVAAVLPARAAGRQDVVAALAGRRGIVTTRKRVPLLGLALAVVGGVVAIAGAGRRNYAVILAGAVLGELGLIVATPALLGLIARFGRVLPLAPRMALRDAARNRASAAPAVAAVMAAVAGSVAIGITVAGVNRHDQLGYHPRLPQGSAMVQLSDASSREQAPQITAALRRSLPAANVVTVQSSVGAGSAGPAQNLNVETPAAARCPMFTSADGEQPDPRYAADPRCNREQRYSGGLVSGALVDDGTTLPALTGVAATEASAALRAGKVVVFDDYQLSDGAVTLRVTDESGSDATGSSYQVPAVVQRDGFAPAAVVLSPAVAAKLQLRPQPAGILAANTSVPTEKQQQAAQGALARLGISPYLYIERGYVNRFNVGLLALVIGAAIITLGAAGIATALANEDGRSDLATLAAVGASPRVRRSLSMARSGVIAGLGTALGLIAGFLPAVGFVLAQRQADVASASPSSFGFAGPIAAARPLVIPWPSLAITALVVPLIAVAVAGTFSRSRLPVERRAAM